MFEELVSDVKGTWKRQEYDEVKSLHLTWMVEGTLIEGWFRPSEIGALSVWLAQPKSPTPNDLAETIVDKWRRDNEVEMNSVGWVVRFEARRDLIARIAVALRAERERESRNV